jgi:hypothetical protein
MVRISMANSRDFFEDRDKPAPFLKPASFDPSAAKLRPTIDEGYLDGFIELLPPPEPTPVEEQFVAFYQKNKSVVLQGLFFSMHFHGEQLLHIKTPVLNESTFNTLKNIVEDHMTVVDAKYAQRTNSRGRSSWEGYGARMTTPTNDENDGEATEDRKRTVKIRVFPRAYLNRLAGMRERLVQTRLCKCIVLEGTTSGRFKQNVYILPFANAASMIAEIDDVNTDIDILNQDLMEYVQGRDYQRLNEILRENGLEDILKNKHWKVGHVEYEAIKLELNPTAVMELVKTARGTIKEELKAEQERGEQLLQAELERRSQEMVTGALMSLKKRIDDNVAKIVHGIKSNPERIKADLDNIRNMAASIGLSALAESVIDPLQMLIDTPERAEELFGTNVINKLPKEIDGRIKALLESL